MDTKYPEDFMKPIQTCFDLLKLANLGFFDAKKPILKKHWPLFFIISFLNIHFICMSCFMKTEVFKLTISQLAFNTSAYIITVQGVAISKAKYANLFTNLRGKLSATSKTGIVGWIKTNWSEATAPPVYLKGLIIIKNKRNMEALVNHLGALWTTDSLTPSQRERKTSFLKRFNVVRKGFYWFCICGGLQNMATPLFLTAVQHDGQKFQLPYSYVLPFQLNIWRYLAVYIFQCFIMVIFICVYLGTELLKIVLCAYLSIEFMLLQEDLKCVSQENTPEEVMKTLKKLVRKHQVLLNLSDLLNNILNQMLFFDLICATVTGCFFAFAATCSRDATLMASNLTAVSLILFPIYVYCYYSAVLGEESSGIADAVYEDLWYGGNMDYQKTICFIIARSQHPCYLKALKYAPLTVLTFTRVVSTAWSYLSLAISLYSE